MNSKYYIRKLSIIAEHDPLRSGEANCERAKVEEDSLRRSKSNLDIQSEIQRNYEKLQRNLSQEFQR